jgi:hypothetical protein
MVNSSARSAQASCRGPSPPALLESADQGSGPEPRTYRRIGIHGPAIRRRGAKATGTTGFTNSNDPVGSHSKLNLRMCREEKAKADKAAGKGDSSPALDLCGTART